MINYEYLVHARQKVSQGAWDYLVGGSDDEVTLRRNRFAFQEWELLPQPLQDTSRIDTTTSFLGVDLHTPIIAAPVGGLTQFHPDGELEWARGLNVADVLGTVSGVSRIEPDRIIRESGAKLFYQLYFFGDDGWIEHQVRDAQASGYRALVLTIDTACYGNRERDVMNGYDARNAGRRSAPPPPDRDRNARLTWEEVRKIVDYTTLPVVLKGLFSVEDVEKALQAGVRGLWISNHGGRQLDYAPASLNVLEALAPVCRQRQFPLIFDGGIRRGTEAAIALLLGADLVAVGRLPIYGLIMEGQKGVRQVFDQLQRELQTAMSLLGLRSIEEIRQRSKAGIAKSAAPHVSTKWDLIEMAGAGSADKNKLSAADLTDPKISLHN